MDLASPFLGTQYYRPPFPDSRRWRSDLQAMRDTGLDALQLWVCWGWVEASPGEFRFDDYDELMSIAQEVGLGVVLSTIAEIQPFWIHRAVPDGAMVNHEGRIVVSSLRRECNVGLTPGACWDHPEVHERLMTFIGTVAERYAHHPALAAWDLWNETRWAVQADGYVCYCASTLQKFRSWLIERHGDLDGINAAWRRRYESLEDVMPGKVPGRPYTDLMEFQRFLTARARTHLAERVAIVRDHDSEHVLSAHSAFPPTLVGSLPWEQSLGRGNDYELAEDVDAFGCSQFPAWGGMSPAWRSGSDVELATRFESAYWAAGKSRAWVSELQGGGISNGFDVGDSVTGSRQARWIWSAVARGMSAVIFWAWRDEVFGYESAGFGVAGNDGHAASRLSALSNLTAVWKEHRGTLGSYRPDMPEIGVLYSPSAYQLDWSLTGRSEHAQASVMGWMETFEHLQLPYRVVEPAHLEDLGSLKLLVLPWCLIVPEDAAQSIAEWVRRGGHLVAEAELDAYDELGFFRYGDERPFANALGIRDRGRRPLDAVAGIHLEVPDVVLPVRLFATALSGPHGPAPVSGETEAFSTDHVLGSGRVLALGSFPSHATGAERSAVLERVAGDAAERSGVRTGLRVTPSDGSMLQWRAGIGGDGRPLLFLLTSAAGAEVGVTVQAERPGMQGDARELISGAMWRASAGSAGVTLSGRTGPDGVAVLAWEMPH